MATQLEPDVHADEEAFRTEVQQFLAAHFPDGRCAPSPRSRSLRVMRRH